MTTFKRSLQAVLWAAIGLGGRRADADQRVSRQSLPWILGLSLLLVVGFIGSLILLVHWVAG